MLRGSRGDAAGIELGSSFAERIAVNTGTVPGRISVTVATLEWFGSCDGRSRKAGPAATER